MKPYHNLIYDEDDSLSNSSTANRDDGLYTKWLNISFLNNSNCRFFKFPLIASITFLNFEVFVICSGKCSNAGILIMPGSILDLGGLCFAYGFLGIVYAAKSKFYSLVTFINWN